MNKLKRVKSKSILIITGLMLCLSLLVFNPHETMNAADIDDPSSTANHLNTDLTDGDKVDALNEGQTPDDTNIASNDNNTYARNDNMPLSISRGSRDRLKDNNITVVPIGSDETAIAEARYAAEARAEDIIAAEETIIADTATDSVITTAAPDKTEIASKNETASEAPAKTEPKAETASAAPAKAASKAPVKAAASTAVKKAAYSESDLDLLARLITAEAQADPYEAQVAVGAVVLNRVKSDSFPNTLREVIYQNIDGYYQFAPVVNGWINKPAEPDSIKAAKEAFNGKDPTNGALFYYDNTTTNTWITQKPVSIRIGNMVYAY